METQIQVDVAPAVSEAATQARGTTLSTLTTIEEPGDTRPSWRRNAIVFALNTVLFVAALNQTVITTAIPTITQDLQSASGYTWIGGAYLIASAASGPLWTRGSDIWGRKPALLGSVVLFAMGSLFAALSRSMTMLISARVVQGIACGGLFQLVAVSISDLFSLRKRALMFGLQGGVYAVAGSSGPLLGGALSQYVTWRWCFWINLPVCTLAFLLLLTLLDAHDPRTPWLDGLKAVDWAGGITMLGMTLLMLLGLQFGGSIFPWNSATVISLLIVGAAMIAAFILAEKKVARYPLMPMTMFGNLSTVAVVLVAVSHSMVTAGVEFYLPLYLQSVQQLSPLHSGLLFLPWTTAAALTDITAGVVIHKTGRYRELTWIGTSLMTLGCGLFVHLWSSTSLSQIVGFQIINGIGVALLFQTPMLVLHATVSQSEVAAATATLGFLRSLATAVSVVIGGAIFQNSMDNRHDLLAKIHLEQEMLDALRGSQAAANLQLVAEISDLSIRESVLAAFAWSVRNIFIFNTCVSGLALLASVFVVQHLLNTHHVETKTGIAHLTPNKR